MQQVVSTLEALGAAGLVMVVESDVAGSKFDPIPFTMPGIVIIDAINSEASPLCPWLIILAFQNPESNLLT